MAAVDRFSLVLENMSRYCGSWRNLFAGIGLLTVGGLTLRSVWTVSKSLYVHFLGARNVRFRLTQYGQWAVITGCTRGIGREFATLLASYGLDVILISRDDTKLKELAQYLETEYGVQTVCVCADFAQGALVYDSIKAVLADKEIGILINNVGVMYDYPDYFINIDERRLWELINVNMGAAQAMSHAVLNASMRRRRRGLIVFVSSMCAFLPAPFMTAYAATKAYEYFLARGLYLECQPLNVHVQALCPSFVATGMTAYNPLIGQANLISPSASTFVRHASWTLGLTDHTTGYFPHTILLWGSRLLPEWCLIRASTQILDYFRRTAIANIEEKQE